MSTVLLATAKPFAADATAQIRSIVEAAGHTLNILESYASADDLLKAVATADALIVRSDAITKDVIAAAPQLKVVVRAGAGYDTIDLVASTARNIVVMNTPGQNANAVAELAIGLMIYAARNLFQAGTGTELRGRTLGLQAYGNVGKLVADHAKGLGMKVCAFDPFVPAEAIQKDGVEPVSELSDLYKRSDYLSLHIPAIPATIGSVGYELVRQLPKGATLLNTARSEVIDEKGLLQVLTERTDLKYVTDVMPTNYAELQAACPGRVYATPKKMGAETAEANLAAGVAAAHQVVDFLSSGAAPFQVNK